MLAVKLHSAADAAMIKNNASKQFFTSKHNWKTRKLLYVSQNISVSQSRMDTIGLLEMIIKIMLHIISQG